MLKAFGASFKEGFSKVFRGRIVLLYITTLSGESFPFSMWGQISDFSVYTTLHGIGG